MTTDVLAGLGIGQLFEVVPDAVIVGATRTGRVVAWNPAAAELLEYEADEAIGMELARLVPPALRQAHVDGLAAYVAGDGVGLVTTRRPVEVPALTRSGREVWVELRLAALPHAPAGYVVAVLRDVTARRRAELEREAALRESERARQALRDFVDALSHDVRSPLSAVQLALDLVERRGDRLSGDQRDEVLRGARTATRAALELVEDLLQINELERGQLQPVPEPVNVRAAAQEAVTVAALEVRVDVAGDLVVDVDPRMLRRMLVNLLTNAGKYGAPPFVVSAAADGAELRIAVQDHGAGVPADVRDVLFERFTRAADAHRSASGLGLGLAIVAGLAGVSGGRVWCEDAPDGGACFVLALPVAAGGARGSALGGGR